MIATEGLKYSYDKGESFHFPDIYCDPKDILLLLGRSGVGKTTLLHLIGGLMPVKEGRITVNNQNLHQMTGSVLDRFRGKNIGIVFQQPHFVQSLHALDNLSLARSLAGLPVNQKNSLTILESLGIGNKAYTMTSRLSQGEKQRLSIARAMINSPSVILADEPTSALDDHHTTQVIELLKEQAAKVNAALIVVTHDSRLKDIISNQIILANSL